MRKNDPALPLGGAGFFCFIGKIRELNKLLPGSSVEEVKEKLPYLADSDAIENYMKLYKFYPNFVDSPYYT